METHSLMIVLVKSSRCRCVVTGRVFRVKRQDNLTDFILGDNETVVSVIAGEMISISPVSQAESRF